ncbi:hypothetical protein JCM6882_006927 [Rhodosporidiobolus microsporus]
MSFTRDTPAVVRFFGDTGEGHFDTPVKLVDEPGVRLAAGRSSSGSTSASLSASTTPKDVLAEAPMLRARDLLYEGDHLILYAGEWRDEAVVIKLAKNESLEGDRLLRKKARFYQRKEAFLRSVEGKDLVPDLLAVFDWGEEEDGESLILVFRPYGTRVDIVTLEEEERLIVFDKLETIHFHADTLHNYWWRHIFRSNDDEILRIADFGNAELKHRCDGECRELRWAHKYLKLRRTILG